MHEIPAAKQLWLFNWQIPVTYDEVMLDWATAELTSPDYQGALSGTLYDMLREKIVPLQPKYDSYSEVEEKRPVDQALVNRAVAECRVTPKGHGNDAFFRLGLQCKKIIACHPLRRQRAIVT